ncbi:MAG: response regulator transcription factor [Gaiellaceae bacterium]
MADWVDVDGAPALCSVEAVCTVDCDCPALDPPPTWVWVLDWLVVLSLLAEEVALFELVCSVVPQSESSLAKADWTWARARTGTTTAATNAKRHRTPFPMHALSAPARARDRPHLAGLCSPLVGGGLYDLGVPARVLVVESNRMVREGIRAQLSGAGAEIVAEAVGGREAIVAAQEHEPDVVILDFNLPDAPDVCDALKASTHVIALGNDNSAAGALESGARAYLLKDADDLDLGGALQRVMAGESVVAPEAAAALIESREKPKLSRQEIKVLRLVAEGLTNPQIGKRLYLSRHTVKEYLSHAMRKLEVTNRIEAVRRATELGLVEGVGQNSSNAPSSKETTLAYNTTGEPARSSDLKVTPLKLDQLRAIRKQQG